MIAVLVGGTLFVSADSGGEASLRESAGVKGLSGLSGEDIIKSKTSPPEGGADYKGYIVKIADEAVARIDAKAMKNASKCIVGDRIALVDKPKDVLKFASAGDVEIIEPNYIYSSFAAPIADAIDPIYTNQNNYQWGVKYVNASVAWQLGYRGDDVNIAILDSGIVKGHEDLGGDKIIEEWNWIGGNSNTADDNMHGSVVGGIIAADTGNYRLGTTEGVGMAGIADKSNLIIHKVLDKSGYGDIGILYALYDVLHDGNRVDVVNMSLGGSGNSNILNGMIQDIAAKGTIIVAASGNNGDATDGTANEMNYPAGCDNVIGVGSIGKTGAVSPFSTKNSSVDVVAPGELMVGLQAGTTNGYYEASGS
ncbi:MAG: S8 family serine peptidase, partial [Clostridiales Family XIII bacterium]|nr:S8 family serine peptidase [Clostridiales Family XIII bacterium]